MPAREQKPDDLQQLGRHAGEHDAQDGRSDDADQDRLVALVLWKTGRRQSDDDGVVAGQNQIDHDDLEEGGQRLGGEECTHVSVSTPD